MSIVLVHLYPRELGINGDVGNVMALRKRAEWRGLPLEVHDHEVGGELPASAHLVHIGSGPVSGQDAVRDDLASITPALRGWADAGVPFLAIAGGWQLLGAELVGLDGTAVSGPGILPSRATLTTGRRVGEVVADSRLGEIAGFENHGASIELLDDAQSFARVTHREGHGPVDEGVIAGHRVGTNLHGPLLPMNPAWADWFLDAAAQLAGLSPAAPAPALALVDERAAQSRAAVRGRLGA
ncbi:MAG: cobyric acid synthase [Leifsonia sp.]|nr:cobyric acid synthase [Leifsonia sp.]